MQGTVTSDLLKNAVKTILKVEALWYVADARCYAYTIKQRKSIQSMSVITILAEDMYIA